MKLSKNLYCAEVFFTMDLHGSKNVQNPSCYQVIENIVHFPCLLYSSLDKDCVKITAVGTSWYKVKYV